MVERIPVDPAADGQQLWLMKLSAVPDRPDRVNHISRLQPESRSDTRLTGWTSHTGTHFRQGAACGEQLRPCGAMYRTVHPAATEQTSVRGVDDRIDIELRDV